MMKPTLMDTVPILYSFRRCPYAMRARMALWAAGVTYELREVALKDKPQDMLDKSPKGTVPVLCLPDGTVIDESLDIMVWALAQNDPFDWLAEPGGVLIAHCDGDFKHHLDRYKYASRYEDADPLEHRALGERFLKEIDSMLSSAPYLFGERRTLADIAVAPFVRQFAIADQAWFDRAPYPHVQRWLDGFLTTAPFTAVMDKHAPWSPGDVPVIINAQ